MTERELDRRAAHRLAISRVDRTVVRFLGLASRRLDNATITSATALGNAGRHPPPERCRPARGNRRAIPSPKPTIVRDASSGPHRPLRTPWAS